MKEFTSNGLTVGSKEYFDSAPTVWKIEEDLDLGANGNYYMSVDNIMRFRQEIAAGRAGTQVAYMTTYLDSIERRSDAYFDSIEGRPAVGRTGQLGSPQVPASRDPRAVLRFVGEQVEQEMNALRNDLRNAPEYLRDFILSTVENTLDAVENRMDTVVNTVSTAFNNFADSLAYFSRNTSNSLVQVATNVMAAAESSITFEVEFGAGIGGGKRLLVGDIRGDLLTVKEVRTFDIRGNLINVERLVGTDIRLTTTIGGLAEIALTEQQRFQVDGGRATHMGHQYDTGYSVAGTQLGRGDTIISLGVGVYFGFGGGGTIYFNLSEFARELEMRFR